MGSQLSLSLRLGRKLRLSSIWGQMTSTKLAASGLTVEDGELQGETKARGAKRGGRRGAEGKALFKARGGV